MSRSEPYVTVECDFCGDVEEITLRATARGNFTEDGIDQELRILGWTTNEDQDMCETCAEEERVGKL